MLPNIFDIPATTQSFQLFSLRRGRGSGTMQHGKDTILYKTGHDAMFSDVFLASWDGMGEVG